MTPPFCLLAAGCSTRNGGDWHKTLLPAGRRAVISHVLDTAPAQSEIVVVLGHQGALVRDYLELAHPERGFTFVTDPEYGRGPALSLACAREHLQRPFILGCCDSVVYLDGLHADFNWVAVSATDRPDLYATAHTDGTVQAIRDKGAQGYPWALTGLCGIQDYSRFWQLLEGETNYIRTLGELGNLSAIHVTWDDAGSPAGYARLLSRHREPWVLEKEVAERTYHVGARCVKLYLDAETCRRKCERARRLGDLIPPLTVGDAGTGVAGGDPPIVAQRPNGFSYAWVPGETIYRSSDLAIWRRLWDWLAAELFQPVPIEDFPELCRRFYEEKTRERCGLLGARSPMALDEPLVINGRRCPPLDVLVGKIPWASLAAGTPSRFHGDLHPDNILLKKGGGFALIDWRESFAGSVVGGDLYYDLGKLHSGLVVSYNRALRETPPIAFGDSRVTFSPMREPHLDAVRAAYEEWLCWHGYDLERVRLVSALVHLNISPLHASPLDLFLLYNGWYALEAILA